MYSESENELQNKVIELAKYTGWRVAHFRNVKVLKADGTIKYQLPVQADGKGWPDLVLVKHTVLYIELKSQKGKLSPEQKDWIEALKNAGQNVYVFKPSDWESIVELLTGVI